MGHARLSPSAASRWTTCPGSVRLISTLDVEDESSLAAEEGTAAHELLELSLTEGYAPLHYRGRVLNQCKLKPEGFTVDDEMIEYITLCYDWVIKYQLRHNAQLFAERKVYPDKLFMRDDCHGTADITLLHDDVIVIGDLKYGAGIMVEPQKNLQLLLYGLGAIEALTVEERKKIKFVDLVILQPRIEHEKGIVRSVRYTIDDIYEWVLWFSEKAADTDNPEAPLVPGESQCFFCPGKKHGCVALRNKTLEVFNVVELNQIEKKILRAPETLTPEERRLVLDSADIIEGFFKAVKGQAQKDLEQGKDVPGFKLVRGSAGHRKWDNEDDVVKCAKALGLKKADMVDEKLKSPKQLLAVAKKAPKVTEGKLEKLEALVVQPEGKLVMVPESDPREAANSKRVENAFKDVQLPNK